MQRRAYYRHGDPRRPQHLRVVQHDKPERLRGMPGIELEWTLREWIRRLGWLAACAVVLGGAWAVGVGLLAAAKWLR